VTSDQRKEVKGILLLFLFIMVVPLIFFPKDFGLKVDMSPFLLFAFELGCYVVIFFILFSKASALWVISLALLTLAYRFSVGICSGLFLTAMFSLDLSSALKLGIYRYLPAFLLQAMMSPFILKSSFEMVMKKRRAGSKEDHESFKKTTLEAPLTFFENQIPKSGRDQMRVSSSTEKKRAKEANLEKALHYLREYSGVKGAILVDNGGLVVGGDTSSDFDPELFASLAICLKEANHDLLKKINESNLERIGIHTPHLWISLNQILSFTLVTVADRHTDELLSVRISQAAGMIKKHLEERYDQKILKGVEELYARDIGRVE
jgi:predicted regulator of Ras-like GTPase activity (Roadblock/LC7/MglB family)